MANIAFGNEKSSQGKALPIKKVLIKFGGSSLSGDGDLDRFSGDIAVLITHGYRPVIVHGGGPEISQEMERRGLKVRKVMGLRITDDEALKVAMEVLSSINSQIVDSLRRAGVEALGMPGSDNDTVRCTKMAPVRGKDENGKEMTADLGNVGEVADVDPRRIDILCAKGIVPVVYPICAGLDGKKYNVNADTVAAHLARAIGSEEIVLVTDVPGILKEGEKGKQVVHETTLNEVNALISAGVITGGMIPKVEACRVALQNGVKVAYMINGKELHSILSKLIDGEECGTKITSE